MIVVTHDHHYDTDGIGRVAKPDATVVVYEAVDATTIGREVRPADELPQDTHRVGYGDSVSIDGVSVDVVPAYNHPDGPNLDEAGRPVHPEGFGCGFLVTLDGRSILWPGDSDVVEAHAELDVSVLAPPIGRSFTMDRTAAAGLAGVLAPDLTLPIHYDTFGDLEADSGAFAAEVAARERPVALDERRSA